MLLLETIEKSINKNIELSNRFYQVQDNAIVEFDKEIENIVKLMNMFISIIPALKNLGLEVPEDILQEQFANMQEALSKKDYMLLSDCLMYEINDTLQIFKELVEEGVIRNEELL